MSEPILKALIQLFALISDIHDKAGISSKSKDIVRIFLSRHLNNELVIRYMEMFDEYLSLYNSEHIAKGSVRDRKHTSLTAVRILSICEKINEELQQKQKLYVTVQLMDFILFSGEITENELDFLETVATAFNIPYGEYRNINCFILKSVNDIPEKGRVMIIDNKINVEYESVKHLFKENLKDEILLLYILSTNTYILRYSGKEDLFLNGQSIFPSQTYVFDNGSTIRSSGINTIFFNDVSRVFTEEIFRRKIFIDASDVSLRFRNSESGIHNLNFHEESGNLVGILGGSGAGKTTLLNVLSGITEPQSGEVKINGFNVYSGKDKVHLRGVIGFVPQDDLIIEELTVFQNLYYNARMCLNNLTEERLTEVVDKTLRDLDLYEARDLKVGNTLNKIISGGQRKRLNIALELIREPTILFVDEPTSGLSSVDSEIVLTLLKEQTYRGKLVIINIHQPGSDLYKMFDKIMILDKGGYQIFYGDPAEAVVYFKTKAILANAGEDRCISCGNVNTDQLLQIIEARVVNEHGKPTRIRKVSPLEWVERFKESIRSVPPRTYPSDLSLPINYYSIPGLAKQTKIFFLRDGLSKLADKQYVLISILGSPLLALLLAWFTRYIAGERYIFSENENLPAYLFMCVITSLFLGLIISAEEIVKDRKILKRESFLNLSWFSYLSSKIIIMFSISAIQTILFILIGNFILEIRGMTLPYWIILFTTSCFANMLGLNISSAFNSAITIYILIPFIIIPQLLFSGVLVKFDRLHKFAFSTDEYVPVIGDMMAARWSFEALAVQQFKKNKYENLFFRYNLGISQNDWYANYLVNTLKHDLWICSKYNDSLQYKPTVNANLNKLGFYIDKLNGIAGTGADSRNWESALNEKSFNPVVARETEKYLDSLAGYFRQQRKYWMAVRDEAETETGNEVLVDLRNNYENRKLRELLLNELVPEKTFETPGKIIQKYQPVYMIPVSRYGRAHFYAPYKMIGNAKIDTFWFNIIVLWLVTLLLFIALYYNILQKTITYFENLRFSRAD
jgi:ABC-type multidrug transport system ATPase subunit